MSATLKVWCLLLITVFLSPCLSVYAQVTVGVRNDSGQAFNIRFRTYYPELGSPPSFSQEALSVNETFVRSAGQSSKPPYYTFRMEVQRQENGVWTLYKVVDVSTAAGSGPNIVNVYPFGLDPVPTPTPEPDQWADWIVQGEVTVLDEGLEVGGAILADGEVVFDLPMASQDNPTELDVTLNLEEYAGKTLQVVYGGQVIADYTVPIEIVTEDVVTFVNATFGEGEPSPTPLPTPPPSPTPYPLPTPPAGEEPGDVPSPGSDTTTGPTQPPTPAPGPGPGNGNNGPVAPPGWYAALDPGENLSKGDVYEAVKEAIEDADIGQGGESSLQMGGTGSAAAEQSANDMQGRLDRIADAVSGWGEKATQMLDKFSSLGMVGVGFNKNWGTLRFGNIAIPIVIEVPNFLRNIMKLIIAIYGFLGARSIIRGAISS